MKTNFLVLIFFFIITFPAYFALLHPGMLTSHDGEGHIIRMFEFNKAIEDGNFPVRWSKRLNWGLGYPFFNFNYPLVYYLTFLMHVLSLDLLTSFKLILILSFPLSGFFAYLFLKNHFGKLAALGGGLFYTLIPYHFLNVYVRGNIGETLASTFVPLAFYLAGKLHQKPNLLNSIFLSLSLSFLILTHNLTAFIFTPIILIYSLLLGINKNYIKYLILGFGLPLLITAFFWIPVAATTHLIIINKTFPFYYLKNFPDFKDLIYSAWGYGGSKTGPGQMSVQIGLLHIFTFLTCLVFIKKIFKEKVSVFFFILAILAVFMMNSLSKPIWDILKPLEYLQFPWRLLSVVALSISFLAGFLINNFPNKIKYISLPIIIVALLIFNRNHWKANEYYSLPSYWFLDKPVNSTTTVDGEHTPYWQKENMPNNNLRYEIVSGKAEVKSLVWKTNYHLFAVNTKKDSLILDRTVYFPGWTVFIDGKKVDRVDQNNPLTKGLIGYKVGMGQHQVEVKLLEPTINKIADSISVFIDIIILIFLCRQLVPNLLKIKKSS